MNAGALRQLVTIQQPVAGSSDNYGQPAVTWSDVATCYAAIEPTGGVEQFRGLQLRATTTHLVRLRFHAAVTSAMRLKWGSRYLYFDGPPRNVGERGRELLATCQEREA